MSRRRTRLNWLYDNDLQQFTTPSGQTITLLQIAQILQDQVNCSHDFVGAWTGWRIRQNRLIAPGQTFKASQITPNNLRAFNRWLRSFEGEQAQLEFHSEPAVRHEQQCAHRPALVAPKYPDDTPRHSPLAKTGDTPEPPVYAPRQRAKVVELASYRKRPA